MSIDSSFASEFLNGISAKDKLVIDKGAAALLNSAVKTVAAIIARREQLDRDGQADKPLVVLMGEFHHMPAHPVHHMKVIQGLIEAKQDFAVGLESMHDSLSHGFEMVAGHRLSPQKLTEIKKNDPLGQLSVKGIMMLYYELEAHFTHRAMHQLLINTKTPTLLNDASVNGNTLNAQDPTTRESIEACFGGKDLDTPVGAMSEDGIFVRNHHMVEETREYLRSSGKRIFLQQCGYAHIAGVVSSGFGAEESLSAIFRDNKLPVQSVLLKCGVPAYDRLPHNHGLKKDETLQVSGLPKIMLSNNSFADSVRAMNCNDYLIERAGLTELVGNEDQRVISELRIRNELRGKFFEWHFPSSPSL